MAENVIDLSGLEELLLSIDGSWVTISLLGGKALFRSIEVSEWLEEVF